MSQTTALAYSNLSCVREVGVKFRIAETSREQTIGIDQISKAVSQIDIATQQNASGADEAAHSSSQMSNEAKRLQEIVEMLHQVVSGSKEVA